MKKLNLSAILHTLAFVAGNGAIIAFVPESYRELATVIANALIGISAWVDGRTPKA